MVLRRHDLVWLSAKGWEQLLHESCDHEAFGCLKQWFELRLPLVVGRQVSEQSDLALGLAAPLCWEKRKLALHAPRDCVLYQDAFPKALDVRTLLPVRLRACWMALCRRLSELSSHPRVHGSYGWQRVTRMQYVTSRSDLDLHLPVSDADVADLVAACLEEFRWEGPRIDGELLFPDGNAVAWREWLRWRRAETREVLVKSLYGVALKSDTAWLRAGAAAAAPAA